MFSVRSLALMIGLSGFAALPGFASLMREPFTPGGSPPSKSSRNNRPQGISHHEFGGSTGDTDNLYSSGASSDGNGPDAPYMPPANWLNFGPYAPYSLGDLNPQSSYGWGSGFRMPSVSWWSAGYGQSALSQPDGARFKAFDNETSESNGDDPPNPSAYLAGPPPGAGMLTPTPEPVHLVYAALAGLLLGGLIRTLRGRDLAS